MKLIRKIVVLSTFVFSLMFAVMYFNSIETKAASNCVITYNKNIKSGIKIKWTNSKKVSGYEVFRSVDGGKYKKYKTLKSKTYTDRNVSVGKVYKYKVRSYTFKYNIFGIKLKKKYQAKSKASSPVTSVPKAIYSVMHNVLTDRVSLTWVKDDLADEYVIYRSWDGVNYEELATVSGEFNSYDDMEVVAGIEYSYKVRVVRYVNDVRYLGIASPVSINFNDVKSKYVKNKINIDTSKLHPYLQVKLNKALKLCNEEGIFLVITEGYRTKAYQDYLYAQGRTRKGAIITYAKGKSYSSQHQWGIAFDIAINGPTKDMYNLTKLTKAASIIKEVGLGWGGDWVGFNDTPHYFLKTWGDTPTPLKKKYKTPSKFKKYWVRTTKKNCNLYANTKLKNGTKVVSIPKGSKLTVYYYKNAGYAKVKFGEQDGYVYRSALSPVK